MILRNHKGMTLVELLISIAVGSIVISATIILLKQGLTGYSKQTISAQLQDDGNITLNQISDAIMQATCIDIYNEDSGDRNTPSFITNRSTDGNAYTFDSSSHILYVGTQAGINYSELGILCKNVEHFKVQIVNVSVKTEDKMNPLGSLESRITGVNNRVQIKVSITLKYGNEMREVSRVTSVRNEIPLLSITIQSSPVSDFQLKSHLNDYFTD